MFLMFIISGPQVRAGDMSGVTTRSKTRQRQNGSGLENGSANGLSHGNDVIGIEGLREGYKALESTGYNRVLNKIVLPLCMLVFCPQFVILYWYTNAHCGGSYSELFSKFKEQSTLNVLVDIWSERKIFDTFTFSVIFGYFAWAIFWMRVLPGKKVYGTITPKGNLPVYTDNGFLHYLVTMAGFAILTIALKCNGMTPTVVYDRFGDLLAFMNVFALVFVFFLYLKGTYFPSTNDSGKTGGGFIFDYYWGTELYPRICSIDVKVLTNCRFGMTIWPLLVCIYALKSYELYGFVDSVFVTAVLQLFYITKFFTWEAGYMQTIDIIVDRAGFYICWGCLCWLPALYPMVSQYLVTHPVRLGTPLAATVLSLGLLSTLINYLADLQRQQVRAADGKCLVWGKEPEIIRAMYKIDGGVERESILLASGWWGISRHFHYIPEILLSFFWTVTTGFEHLLPYTYVLFLITLLTHRSFRDENKCSKKYGAYWEQYCVRVPYRIVPYVF